MRVDRFLEAKFPSLSFSHIQRVIRKGELRVDGKRADGKDRLAEEPGGAHSRRSSSTRRKANLAGSPMPRKSTLAFLHVDHALRGRRRARLQQADGARRAGRLRHHAPPRRHARRHARQERPASAPGAPARQGHLGLPAGRQDALCGVRACPGFPLARGPQDLLGPGGGGAEAAPGPHLDLPGQGRARGQMRWSCASPATARRERAMPSPTTRWSRRRRSSLPGCRSSR